jgi:hypothetical protein
MARAKKAAKKKTKPAKKPSPAKTAKARPAKPKAAKAAKPKPASKLAATTKSASGYSALARAGKLDALFGLMDLDSSTNNDRNAYKWLTAASDFGHEDADDMIGDVMEVSSMRYDDDQFEAAAAHWELAAAYLEGADGLQLDLELAKQHLDTAFTYHDLEGISSGTNETYLAEPLLARLSGDAKALLETALESAGSGGSTEDDAGDDEG